MLALRFNSEQFYADLRERLVVAMDALNDEFFRAATSGMSSDARAASEKDRAVVEGTTDYKGALPTGADPEYINARCWFYADAILESYGIGSKADRGPRSQWEEYEKSDLFNPARKGRMNIVGRPASPNPYKNIWGEDEYTSGRNAGKNLERLDGLYVTNPVTGLTEKIEPKKPTYAIQNAEVWLMQNRETSMERRIRTEIEKFIAEVNANPLRYFYHVDV